MVAERLLVIDDDRAILSGLEALLQSEGYQVDTAGSGHEGLALFAERPPSLVLLDVLMPRLSGLEVCQRIRRVDPEVPIILLTAKGEESDKVHGLDMGADDYMVKPFSAAELLARVRAALRRRQASARLPDRLTVGPLSIDCVRRRVAVRCAPVALTAREFDLLTYLLERRGTVVSRAEVLAEVWGYERAGALDTRTVDTHVARLRSKLGMGTMGLPDITAVRGTGYQLEDA